MVGLPIGVPGARSESEPLRARDLGPLARTALWTAFCRADETCRPNPRIRDDIAERLLDEDAMEIGAALEKMGHAHDSIVARTRIVDERIAVGLALDGFRAVATLGAGLDSRFARFRHGRPGEFTDPPKVGCEKGEYLEVRFLELDDASLVGFKRQQLQRAGLHGPTMVCGDLRKKTDVLALLGHLSEEPTLVVLEGVLSYLERDDVDRLFETLLTYKGRLRVIADVGGGLFSQVHQHPIRRTVAFAGAPYRTFFRNAASYFEGLGHQVTSNISLPDWDAQRSDARFARPLGANWIPGYRDLARILDVDFVGRF